ncbi:hypothetical protein Tco_0535832 [Tanacetum coccineum]
MVYETEQVAKLGIFKDISGTSHYSVCLGDVTKTQQCGASRSCVNTTYEPPINDSVPVAEGSTSVFNKRRCVLSEGSSAKHRDTVGASQENNIHTAKLHKKTRLDNSQYGISVTSSYVVSLKMTIQRYSKSSNLGKKSKSYYNVARTPRDPARYAETVDKAAHMAKPNNYINGTRKNLVSSDNEGRMVEKCIVEIQGTFLEKIRVAHEWFTKEFMGSITTWDNMIKKFILKFHHLSDHNDDEEEEDSSETDNAPEFFMIEGKLFDFETPLNKKVLMNHGQKMGYHINYVITYVNPTALRMGKLSGPHAPLILTDSVMVENYQKWCCMKPDTYIKIIVGMMN